MVLARRGIRHCMVLAGRGIRHYMVLAGRGIRHCIVLAERGIRHCMVLARRDIRHCMMSEGRGIRHSMVLEQVPAIDIPVWAILNLHEPAMCCKRDAFVQPLFSRVSNRLTMSCCCRPGTISILGQPENPFS